MTGTKAARSMNRLTDAKCKAAAPRPPKKPKPGAEAGIVGFRVSDGGGLYLNVKNTGGKSWSFVWRRGDKWREMGLGSYPAVPLAKARALAAEARKMLADGLDPLAQRERPAEPTFGECAGMFLADMLASYRNEKHKAQWRSTLETHARSLRDKRVSEINADDVLGVLKAGKTPLWSSTPETASRLRGRIERVLDYAKVRGWRSGENPALWRGNLQARLPGRQKLSRGHHPAVQIADAPRWFAALRERDGMGARALLFAALTAARSQEVRGARWDEIDLDAALWTVPAERMKMARPHRVPLSAAAVAILEALPRVEGNPLVFPAPRGGELSDMTLSAAMKRLHAADVEAEGPGFVDRASKRPAVPHGLRSTFRDWAAEETTYPGDMAEIALAHKVGSEVEAAYRRGDMLMRRRRMMEDWSDFLAGKARAGADTEEGA